MFSSTFAKHDDNDEFENPETQLEHTEKADTSKQAKITA